MINTDFCGYESHFVQEMRRAEEAIEAEKQRKRDKYREQALLSAKRTKEMLECIPRGRLGPKSLSELHQWITKLKRV